MISILFPDVTNFTFDLCGKFQAPSSEWMHLTRNLVNFELMVVTEGTLFLADEHRFYTVQPGEYLLLPPTIHQHGFRKSCCSFHWLHFVPDLSDAVPGGDRKSGSIPNPAVQTSSSAVQNSSSLPLEFHTASPSSYRVEDINVPHLPPDYPATLCIPQTGKLLSADRVIILMKQLQDNTLRYHNPFLNNSLTAAILGELHCQSPFYRAYASETQRSQILQDLISYIQYHSSESLKVTELATHFGYNDKYLSSLFHEETGIALKQFILKAKMDSAMAELTDTNHPIAQIAYNVGFQDAHNFSTAFRKQTGMTPAQYRKSYSTRKITFE